MSRVTGIPGSWEVAFELPSTGLRQAVRCYQGFRIGEPAQGSYLQCPDGLVTVIVGIEGKYAMGGMLYESPLCGPRTRALIGEPHGTAAGVRIALAPWAAFRLFGVAMRPLVDTVVELADVAPDLESALVVGVRDATSWPERFAVVDRLLAQAYAPGSACAPEVVRAWRELSRTAGRISVSALAEHVGWCERHLETRFREQIGLSPKAAARVLRLRRARRLLSGPRPMSEVALSCGYYDQAHLCREFRTMTGYTPASLGRLHSYGELQIEAA